MITKTVAFTRAYCFKPQTFRILRMASISANVPYSSNEVEISLRAQRRKLARSHFNKRHGKKLQLNVERDRGDDKIYYIENGLRKVYPYYFNFCTYTKGRWVGKTILQVFVDDFSQTGENHKELIENGKITVNGQKVPIDFVLSDNMLLEHTTHRHEMPVLNEPIEIIEDTNEILVINKPASIPVHPCGRYRENSITQILKLHGYDHLRILYRLDRLTSGLLIMPKTTKTSRKLETQLQKQLLQKQYVCRVMGEFPEGEVVCNEKLGCLSKRLAIYGVDRKNGKPSMTTFTRLSYNGRTSVVKCVPHTGRTHQIRLHLQFLGYPICNDPLYNSTAFGPSNGKGGVIEKTPQEIEGQIMKTSNVGRWIKGDNPRYIAKFIDNQTVTESEVSNKHEPTTDVDLDTVKSTTHNEQSRDDKTGVMEMKVSNTEVEACDDSLKDKSEKTDIRNSGDDSDIPSKRIKIADGTEDTSNVGCDLKGGDDIRTSDIIKDRDSLAKSSKELGDIKGESKEELNDKEVFGVDTGTNVKTNEIGEKEEGAHETDEGNGCPGENVKRSFFIHDVAPNNTDPEYDVNKDPLDKYCDNCKHEYHDPDKADLMIYLHAVSYKGPDWEYSTTLPYWATEDFDERTDTKSNLKCDV